MHFLFLRLTQGICTFYWLAASVFVIQSCAGVNKKSDDPGYKVEGLIRGAGSKMVYLTDKSFYNDTHPKDSVMADSSGHFLFTGKMKEPAFYALIVQDINAPVDFILENCPITISGSTDSLWTATVEGSKENDIHREFIPFTGYYAYEESLNAIEVAYDSASRAGDTSALTRMRAQKEERSRTFRKSVQRFMKAYPLSVTAVNTLFYFIQDDLNGADSLLRGFESSAIGSHKQVNYFRKLIDIKKSLLPGKIAPDFNQMDTSGKMVGLSSFRGRYVLVDFWASWCGPCRQENPNLVKIYNRYKNKGFAVLSVSLDDKKENWLKAIKKDQLQQWAHVSDLKGWRNEAAVQYGIDAVPASMLLDPSGKIIAKDLRGEELEKKIQELYK